MEDCSSVILSCKKWQELPAAYGRINATLPPDVRKRMGEIMVNYLARFGPEGVFARMNDRTIAQILAEYDQGDAKRITSGQADGLRYELYDAPN